MYPLRIQMKLIFVRFQQSIHIENSVFVPIPMPTLVHFPTFHICIFGNKMNLFTYINFVVL